MISIEEQLYGLSLLWSEAKYNFAFWESLDLDDWDFTYAKLLKKFNKPMGTVEYYLELSSFLALLNAGHTKISFPDSIQKSLPIKCYYVNGRHFIANVKNNYTIPIASEILALNEQNFHDYLQHNVSRYCCKQPNNDYMYRAYDVIPYVEYEKEVIVSTNNGEFVLLDENDENWKYPQKGNINETLQVLYKSKEISIFLTQDNMAIIEILSFNNYKTAIAFYRYIDKIRNCKGIIIDIRDNTFIFNVVFCLIKICFT